MYNCIAVVKNFVLEALYLIKAVFYPIAKSLNEENAWKKRKMRRAQLNPRHLIIVIYANVRQLCRSCSE